MAHHREQTELEPAARGEHKGEIVDLTDKNDTTLKEGDVLVNDRTGEKLVALEGDDFSDSIRYYSTRERDEGLHAPKLLPDCFDYLIRSTDGAPEIIDLEMK